MYLHSIEKPIDKRFHPQEQYCQKTARIALALGKDRAHFLAVLRAKRRWIEVEQSTEEPH